VSRAIANTKLTGVLLIAVNLIPLYGVFFWDWDVFPLILLYWLENVWLGLMNIIRIMAHPGLEGASPLALTVGKIFTAGFFTVHYGMFCFVHGVFVFQVFGEGHISRSSSFFPSPEQIAEILQRLNLWPIVAALALSHLISLLRNYFWAGERHSIAFNQLMGMTYARVIVLHVALLFGGFLIIAMGSPLLALIILVLAKTAFDLKMHQAEHQKAAAPI
jgi:uncharacterized protein DUF6498